MNGAPPATARLFLALWPDPATRQTLAAWRDRWAWPAGAAVVADERLHLTLHFIGPVARDRIAAVQAAVERPCPRFAIGGGHATVWPKGLALWVPDALPPAALALQGALGDALRAAGLAVEDRPFRPHVTLARKAAGALPPADALVLDWRVRDIALVESHQGYRVLARFGG